MDHKGSAKVHFARGAKNLPENQSKTGQSRESELRKVPRRMEPRHYGSAKRGRVHAQAKRNYRIRDRGGDLAREGRNMGFSFSAQHHRGEREKVVPAAKGAWQGEK